MWEDLPEELHRLVLDMLPRRNACVARVVCKPWRGMVDEIWAGRPDATRWPARMDEHLAKRGMVWPCICAGDRLSLLALPQLVGAMEDGDLPRAIASALAVVEGQAGGSLAASSERSWAAHPG